MTQQGDVLIFQTPDGGEITATKGITQMTGGFESAAYLSLFGGNQDDDGTQNSKENWWGNLIEEDPNFHYRSRTQYLLTRLVPISGNLVRLEDAVLSDLQWLIDIGAVDSITSQVSLTGVRKVDINIEILADSKKINIQFLANWQAMEIEFNKKPIDKSENIAVYYEYQKLTTENDELLTTENDEILLGKIKL